MRRFAQCYVYGNGNAVIIHQHDPVTGTARVLDEASRLTPAIRPGSQMVDIGFIAAGDGGFRPAAVSTSGGMDIFGHDAVVRCPAWAAGPGRVTRMDVLQVGPLQGNRLPDSAVSAGPCLDVTDFAAHPVNDDPALGSLPPFTNRRMARLVLYQDQRSTTHLRLFDGRPGAQALVPGCANGPFPGSECDGTRISRLWRRGRPFQGPGSCRARFTTPAVVRVGGLPRPRQEAGQRAVDDSRLIWAYRSVCGQRRQ